MNKLYSMEYDNIWKDFRGYKEYNNDLIHLYNEKKENDFWDETIRKNTQQAYIEYVSVYPHGRYIDKAKIKIDTFIQLEQKEEERRKEEQRKRELQKEEEERRKEELKKIKLKKEKEQLRKEEHQRISLYLEKYKIFFNSFPKLKNELSTYLTVKDLDKLSYIISIIEKIEYLFQEFNIMVDKLIKLGISKDEALSFIKLSKFKILFKDFELYSNLINQIPEQKLYEWKPIDKLGNSVCPWLINKSEAWVDRKSNMTIIILPKEITYEKAIPITINFNEKEFAGKKNWSFLNLNEINYLTSKKFLNFIALNTVNRVWIKYSNISGMASSFNLKKNIREITSSTKDICSIVLISK